MIKNSQTIPLNLENQIYEDAVREIFRATKLPYNAWLRKIITPIVNKPVSRFAAMIADFDETIKRHGFPAASRKILLELTGSVVSDGVKNIPLTGPLILASNHPGTYDGLAIISNLPRDDFRLIVSGVPFFQNLPNASQNLIFATHDVSDRMAVIRSCIRHLQEGGALLIFPSGRLDPDPSIFSNASDGLKRWSRSLEVFTSKVPEANLVLTIASGILSKKFINNPLLKLYKDDHEKRRLMEFIQIINQMVLGKPLNLSPKVSFSTPMKRFNNEKNLSGIQQAVIQEKAAELLACHIGLYYPLSTN